MRTQEEINRQIDGLLKMKTWLPEFSMFGDPNWEKIDAQVSVLKGGSKDDFDEGDWEAMDETNQIYRAAEEAEDWLSDDITMEDLFEEGN